MKKTNYMKSIFLLCLLLAGAVSVHADGYDYVYEKVTDLSELEGGETVLLVDQSNNLALSPSGETYGLKGVEIAIGEDNVIRNLSADIIWTIENPGYNSFTLKYNDNYLWGSFTSPSVSVSSNSTDATNVFVLEDYGANGGKLCYEGYNQYSPAYFSWSTSDDKTITIDSETQARFTLYKVTIKNYVKWKRVDGNKVKLNNNEEVDVVIVDLKTGKAMSNDKGDKDPAAVAVTLNDDQDRIIMDEVPENVQWKCNKFTALNITTVTFKTKDDQNLYADTNDKVLKVGNAEGDNNIIGFLLSVANQSLSISIDQTEYRCFSDDSMFSNVWKLGDSSDDNAKNAQIAIFKKVEDPQKIVKIELPEYYNYDLKDKDQYTLYERDFNEKVTITGAEKTDINWSSSKSATESESAVDINQQGTVTLNKRGTTVITASVDETLDHDKASAKCTVIVDDSGTAELGTKNHPLTVKEAKELAETKKVELENGTVVLRWEEGVNYYIKGKVSKVNSGMMAMFGDMDFGEMGIGGGSGSDMDFEDMMDFDMDDMGEMGDMGMDFDMSSMGFDLSAFFGSSDKVTYYISDDGTKDGQMKVINGCGTLKGSTGTMEFNPIPKLSPGDCVVVCGPLVYTEDTSMFSGMMGNNNSEDPKMSGKVDEMNYLAVFDPTLLVEDKEIYVNKSLKVEDGGYTNHLLKKGLYSIDNLFDEFNEDKIADLNQIQEATFKSSDEDIAKWDEDKKELIGVNEGKAKITVKVKVIVTPDDPNTEDKNEEKSYTMKRKFKLTVKTRDLDPAGYYDGEWVLTTEPEKLYEGTRLVLVGTRMKDDKKTDYIMGGNNSMMGGGKSGSKIEMEDPTDNIPSSVVIQKKALQVVLEKDEENASFWNLKVGIDENDNPLYLYATAKTTEEESNGIMEMFNSSSGMKVGTKEDAAKDGEEEDMVASLKASIDFLGNNATIKFDGIADEKNNTIMLTSAFDMEAMMEMFGSMGNNEEDEPTGDEPTGDEPTEEESSTDMSSFDMFMASFNTKKPGDENAQTGEDGKTKAPKAFMPRIYRFVPDETFNITFGSEWRTIVTYKDVTVPDNVEAYIVTKVTPDGTRYKANLKEIKNKQLKSGEPYLLHYTSPADSYTMTLLTPNVPDELEAPEGNLLLKSDRRTTGTKTSSNVYVLANKSYGVGFYKWTGDELGAGRVYLPIEGTAGSGGGSAKAFDFCNFLIETAIDNIKKPESDVKQYYNLNGQRVTKPSQKGVYIVNGKTVVVK